MSGESTDRIKKRITVKKKCDKNSHHMGPLISKLATFKPKAKGLVSTRVYLCANAE